MGTNVVQWSNFDDQVRFQPINIPIPSIPWTPADITTAIWLDAADASTITEVTGVSNWADKGGDALRDYAQATGTLQPSYASNAVTGDGLDDYLINSESIAYGGSTIIALYKASNIATNEYIFATRGNGGTKSRFNLYTGGCEFGDSAITATAITANIPSIVIAKVDGTGITNQHLYVDGTLDTSAASNRLATDDGIPSSAVFAYGNGGAGWSSAVLNEFILIDSAVDTDTRQKIEGYMAWRWDVINGDTALVTALPAGHPYKSAAPTA